MAYITRAQWGAPALSGAAHNRTSPANRRGFVVHWDGGRTPTTAADEIALMRAYHNHHRNLGNGGFPYNLAVGPVTGNVYEGRGLDNIGAHAGGANTANIGVILIGGPGNLTDQGKEGLREAYALANRHTGRTLAQRVHSDINQTSCPGPDLRAWVHGGGLGGGNAPSPSYQPGDITVGASVRTVQERLVAHGHSVGSHGIDGRMGPDTIAAIRAFQTAKNIAVDGIVGPDTWARLSAPVTGGGSVAPAYPLPRGWYFGPKEGPRESVSGYFGNREHLRTWQQRMKDRGWHINPDGLYGPETRGVAIAFQREKRLKVDGLIGPETWRAAWEAPIT